MRVPSLLGCPEGLGCRAGAGAAERDHGTPGLGLQSGTHGTPRLGLRSGTTGPPGWGPHVLAPWGGALRPLPAGLGGTQACPMPPGCSKPENAVLSPDPPPASRLHRPPFPAGTLMKSEARFYLLHRNPVPWSLTGLSSGFPSAHLPSGLKH